MSGLIANPHDPAWWSVFANCTACHMPIAARIRTADGSRGLNPSNYPGDLTGTGSPWVLCEVFPALVPIDVPMDIPVNVAKAFKQAAESRKGGHLDAAAAMYRKAMELALKALSPQIEAWKIEKRIDKMAAEGLITQELQSWAHELRLDGNDVLHEDDATLEMVDQMHGFCKFLLTYMYTLPEQVRAARTRRSEQI
jgi:hypothetical protein